MSASELIEQFKALPTKERAQVAKFVVENDDSWIPESFKQGKADAEAGRFVDLDTTLNRPYSCAIAASKSGPSSTTRSLIRFYPRAKCQNEYRSDVLLHRLGN